jgi:cysteinyl-tRNA synthetase
VSLRLYDTATRQIREFVPLRPGHVGIYHCGLTVQGPPHIGHIRKEVVFDVLRRWLEYTGHEVTVVANVTDIDDKILAKSDEAGRPWWAVAFANERALDDAYEILGCRLPAYQPRATGHVPEMVELMSELVERGYAYPAPDGAGDVYFDVRSWPSYGELSRQRIEDMEPAADADPRGKRDPRDFALWKAHKEGEDTWWESPWGRGRPGWHIECSAMAEAHLGPVFEIHGGGLDLVFPHHENEVAQSRSLGHEFAKLWMHNGMLQLSGEKMSKSIGNIVSLRESLEEHGRETLLVYFLGGHWRKPLDYSDDVLRQAAAQVESFRNVFRQPSEPGGDWEAFTAALDDDFNTPEALATMHGWRDHELLLRGLEVFGLESLAENASAPAALEELARQRADARERKDFDEGDRLRGEIEAAGWEVRDVDAEPGFQLVPKR